MLRNTLKRQARADLLRRLENSARIVEEYEEIVDMYDKLDANRERRERYHEIRQAEYRVGYVGSKQKGYKFTFTETEQEDDFADDVKEDNNDKTDVPHKPDNSDTTDSPDTISQDEKKKKQYQKKEKIKNHVYNEGAIIPPPLNHPYWRELLRGDFINYIFDNYMEMWQIVGDSQVSRPLRSNLTDKQKEALFLSAVRLATTEQIGCYTNKSDRAVRRLLSAALENIRKPLAIMTRQRLEGKLPVTLEKQRFLAWYEQQNGQKETPGETPDES